MKSLKKHRIHLFSLAIIMVVALVVGACGGGGNTPGPAPAPAPAPAQTTPGGDAPATEDLGPAVSLRLGHCFPTTDYRAMTSQKFADLCEEYSDGNITMTLYPANTLTTSQDALKLTAQGVADIAMGALSFNVGEVPALAPLDLQGIYDPDHFWETYDVIKPTLDKILTTQNQICLIMFDETDSIFYITDRVGKNIQTPDDIKGLRLRDHGVWIGNSMANWGASPQTVMPADIAVALERGTVDGGYTGWGFVRSYNCYEVASFISFSKLSKSCFQPLNINLDVWNSLSQGQREIMLRSAAEAQEYGKELVIEFQEGFMADLERVGASIYYLTKEENQAFVDLSMNLIDECREISGELGNELIDAFLSAPSNYR